MKASWRANDILLTKLFKANRQTYEPSWSEMCDAHGVRDVLDVGLFPDLGALSREFMKHYLDGGGELGIPRM
jgi:hypothetical protein